MLPYADSVSTSGASTEPSDPTPVTSPDCGNGSRAKSVWYRFTAPTTGTITADTFDSDYDTILSVYTGSCGTLTPVPGQCNDDDPFDGAQSKVLFQAPAGTTYYFMITAFENDGGNLTFHLRFLPTPVSCLGDCDGSGRTTAADLTKIVAILIGCPCATGPGGAAVGCSAVPGSDKQCTSADFNGDGCISAAELNGAVSSIFECELSN